MINNNVTCMIFIPRIVFAWFQPKRSDIEWWAVMAITVNDSSFFCWLRGFLGRAIGVINFA